MYQLCTSLLELENLSSEHRTEVIRNHDTPAEVIVVCSAASSREKCCSARDDKQHCACENERTNERFAEGQDAFTTRLLA